MIASKISGLILFTAFLLSVGTSCKGHREFREARKELKAEKAERKAEQERAAEEATQGDAEVAQRDHFPDSLVFAMARTPCFGRCPTYELNIYESGYATYFGESNVDRIGEFSADIDPVLADSILQKAQRIGFMMMMDSYDNSLVTDLPSTFFKLNIGGQKKEIKCRIGCPERLMEFGREVEELLNDGDWRRIKD